MTAPYTYGLQLNNRHIILIWNFMIKCNIMMFNHKQICLELVAAASNWELLVAAIGCSAKGPGY